MAQWRTPSRSHWTFWSNHVHDPKSHLDAAFHTVHAHTHTHTNTNTCTHTNTHKQKSPWRSRRSAVVPTREAVDAVVPTHNVTMHLQNAIAREWQNLMEITLTPHFHCPLPADFEFLNRAPVAIQPTVPLPLTNARVPRTFPTGLQKKKIFSRITSKIKQESPRRSSSTHRAYLHLQNTTIVYNRDDMMCWCCEVVTMRTGDVMWSCEVVKIWLVMRTCGGVGGDAKPPH